MLGRAVCGHHTALAPLPLCRAHESRYAAFRPQTASICRHTIRCAAAKDADELQLVKREGAFLARPSTACLHSSLRRQALRWPLHPITKKPLAAIHLICNVPIY